MADGGGGETVAIDLEPGDLGIIDHLDPQPLGGQVIGVHQRLAAAQEERVGAVQRQGAADGLLETDTVVMHPSRLVSGFFDGDTGQVFVGFAGGDPHQVVEILIDRIAICQHIGRGGMGGAQVSGVARIAATKPLGCGLGNEYAGAAPGRRDRGTQRRVAATRNQDVICLAEVCHR